MQIKNFFRIAFILLFATVANIMPANAAPLPGDQAFVFSAQVANQNQINVQWQMPPGYYLYADRIQIDFNPTTPAKFELPKSVYKEDKTSGRVEIFENTLAFPVVMQVDVNSVQMNVDYQGCSKEGFCYPPMHKALNVDFTNNTVTEIKGDLNKVKTISATHTRIQTLLTDQNRIESLLGSQNLFVTLMIFLGIGLLLSFTPCVLPMIPILTSIIVGHKKTVSAKRGFLLSSTYVFGSAITYSLAGLAAALIGSSLQAWLQKPIFIAIVSGMFVIFALSLFEVYHLNLPRKFQNAINNISHKFEGGNYGGVFLMGMISALIVSPCVTAPLIGVLMYISQTGNAMLGTSALFVMGLGMGIPLILIGMSAGKWLPKNGMWMVAIKKFFGILMLGMAIWLLSRVVSSDATLMLSSLLLIGAAYFFIVYLPGISGWKKFHRAIGVGVGIYAMVLMVGVFMPNLLGNLTGNQINKDDTTFVVVHNLAEFNKELAAAQAEHKPVILDFYADWCESCVAMDRKVFSEPDVQAKLSQFVLIRADLSSNSPADEEMLKTFDVIAPPTVLFFNKQGESSTHRIVGEVNPNQFLKKLNTFVTASCDKSMQC